MGVVPQSVEARAFVATVLLLGVLATPGVSARKLISIEESIREDPDLSEVLRPRVEVFGCCLQGPVAVSRDMVRGRRVAVD